MPISDIRDDEAVVNITYNNFNGDLTGPVPWDATDDAVKAWVTESVRAGDVPGIDADVDADFTNFVVRRYEAKDGLPNRFVVRPKVPFGARKMPPTDKPVTLGERVLFGCIVTPIAVRQFCRRWWAR